MTAVPVRRAHLEPVSTVLTRRDDGSILMRSPEALGPFPDNITDRLVYWAETAPDRVFIARRPKGGGDWVRWSYAATFEAVRKIGQGLLDRGLTSERPIAILSGNGIDHALLALAAMYVGIPYAPISPAYSLVSSDYGKLRHILEVLTPGMIFADDGNAFAAAIGVTAPSHRWPVRTKV